MNQTELKKIAENLIETFHIAGKESINLYSKINIFPIINIKTELVKNAIVPFTVL